MGGSKLAFDVPGNFVADDDLKFRFATLADGYSPPQNLLAFFTTSSDLDKYVKTGIFPFIPKASIRISQLKSNRAISREMFTSVKQHLYRTGYRIAGTDDSAQNACE